ncbi:MAG TPA: hypothetical protein VHB18_17390 [Mycobacteriales bacterium]|nr:hypothetical protein [Mycobacteriales bacterium]
MTDHPLGTASTDDESERRRRGLLWLWLAVVAVLVAGLFTAIHGLNGSPRAFSGQPSGGGGSGSATASGQSTSPVGAQSRPVSIQVSGSQRGGLAPGVTSPVVVRVSNTGDKPARVTSARVLVGDASASCTAAESIRATKYNASALGAERYDVAPGQSIKIPLAISMLDLPSNQNACKNARFPLTFQATAQQG